LLDDAAHSMLPSLGQGACQALEDAVVLADCLSTQADVSTALHSYDRRRVRRAAAIVQQSRRMDRLMLCRSPVLAWCRNRIVAQLPAALRARQIRWILEHRPV
jgi:2-polyprenyl-6-methoxyphenol hydroxylase-like FAD-dependent oxidoreductase